MTTPTEDAPSRSLVMEDDKVGLPAARAEVPSTPGGSPCPQPVFLHSSFRTGSTWLWSKLRAAPTTLAYYEIFHEMLATMTPAQARGRDPSDWDSRHPVSAAYFLEFLPLLAAGGGIAGIDRPSSLDGFIPGGGPDGDLAPAEQAYVEHLVSGAWSKQRIPVLTCTRSLGRARALRRCLNGKSIFLHRNLFHQWASYSWQIENGNPYFMDTIRRSIEAAVHDPFLRSVADWYGLGDPSLPRETLFQVFLLLHLYLYSIAFDAADVIVDLNAIASDEIMRQHVEREISEMIFHRIDLSDVRETCDAPAMAVEDPKKMRDTIDQFTKLIPATRVSPGGVAFVQRAKDAALAEWERFEFFTRRTYFLLTRNIDAAETRCAEQAARADAFAAQTDRLGIRLAEASEAHAVERVAQAEAIRQVTAERDLARDLLIAAQADGVELINALETERQVLAAAHAETRTSAQRASQAEAETQELRARSAEAEAALEAHRLQVIAQTAVQTQRLAEAGSELQDLRACLQTATAERDDARRRGDALEMQLAEAAAARDDLDCALTDARSKLNVTLYERARRRLLRPR